MCSTTPTTKVTRARTTSNKNFSAAAIAVVSAVNPDTPGAFFLRIWAKVLCFFLFLASADLIVTPAFAHLPYDTRTAMNNATDNNILIRVTPMLFHHIDLGMTYGTVLKMIGKSAQYCDSGDSFCAVENGAVSMDCVSHEFIEPSKSWYCHWQGLRSTRRASELNVWFVGDHVTELSASMPDGTLYRRDTGNTVHIEKLS